MVAAAALLAALVAAFALSAGVPFGSAQAQQTTGSVSWSVQVEGMGSDIFREVAGLQTALTVVQSKVEGSRLTVKAAGKGSASNIVLRRGLTEDMSFYDWHRQVVANGTSGTRKNGTITLFDSTQAALASFEFTNGWPARYRVVQDEESGVVVEEVTLAVDDLQRAN
jgi:phage tail-like protein